VRFFESHIPEEQRAFLRAEGISFLFVNAAKDPQRFERIPGMTLLKAASIGSLLQYTPEGYDTSR